MDRQELYKHLEENSDVFRNPVIKDAFKAVDRADFVGEDYAVEAYEDYAIPIGHDRWILKPTVAAFMLEVLDVHAGDHVLEVASGSGWVTALLAHMVGESGQITAMEAIPELVEESRVNISKSGIANATIGNAGIELGSAKGGPYDRIFCSGDAESVPAELVDQLKPGGILVMPVGGSITKVLKSEDGEIGEEQFPGVFIFSPLQ